ncbi:MAG: hypothetical protein AAGC55_13640, partial [Myxococcota bacterium]
MLVLLLAALVPAEVLAQSEIVLVPLRGDEPATQKRLYAQLLAALETRFQVATRDSASVDGTLGGVLLRRRADFYLLRIQLIEKASRKSVKEFTVTLRQPNLRRRTLARISDELDTPIAQLAPFEPRVNGGLLRQNDGARSVARGSSRGELDHAESDEEWDESDEEWDESDEEWDESDEGWDDESDEDATEIAARSAANTAFGADEDGDRGFTAVALAE